MLLLTDQLNSCRIISPQYDTWEEVALHLVCAVTTPQRTLRSVTETRELFTEYKTDSLQAHGLNHQLSWLQKEALTRH